MSALSAAEHVLREAGKPLPCREITRKALAHGYWTSKGKTPWATIAAQLYSNIKKHGAGSRFIQTGPDTFGLNPNPASRVARSKPTKEKKTSGRKLSFTAAAEKLLRERQEKAPVHYRDLTKRDIVKSCVSEFSRV